MMTWEQIVEIEPRIQALYNRMLKPHEQTEYEWASVKMEFTNLVGFFAESDNDALTGSDAYDTVYERMLKAFWRGYVENEAS